VFDFVAQKVNERGCGTACVAMIAGVSFDEADRVTSENCKNKEQLIGIANISKSLKDIDAPHRVLPRLTVSNLNNRAVRKALKELGSSALVKTQKENSIYHWMLWDSEKMRFLNPLDKSDRTAKCWKLDGYAILERVDYVLP